MTHQLEVLLRPPVELWSGAIAFSSGLICAMAPSTFMMTPTVGMMSAFVLCLLGIIRFKQGASVIRYQRNLKRLPRFDMTSSEIPCYKNYLYLGKGFKWTQKHTQRLKDTLDPDARKYVEPTKLYTFVRKLERDIEGTFLGRLGKLTSIDSPFNPFRPLPPIGGNPALHGVELDEVDVLIPMADRTGHTLVEGSTRVGKSRLAEILIEQDIQHGKGPVILIDPKSDAGLLTRMYTAAKRQGKEDDFYIFHLGFPEISSRYNAVGNFSRITEIASRISGQLSAEGNSAAFKEFAWRFVNIVARALVSLGQRPEYNNILRYVTDIEPLFVEYMEWWLPKNAEYGWVEEINDLTRDAEKQFKANPKAAKYAHPRTEALRKYVEINKVSDQNVLGLLSALRYDKTYFDKIVASLLPLLEKLTTGKTGKLIAPDYFDISDDRPIIDWTQIIRKKAIVYIGLDAMTDKEVAAAVGNSMFADLVSTAGWIYKHGYEHGMLGGRANQLPEIFLYADEFNELMGEEFIPMVNKGGGAGIRITALTQSRSDIEAKIGNAAKARQVEGNFNNLIMLRVKEKSTAELLTDQLPEVQVKTIMSVSGANDSSDTESKVDFTSGTQDRTSKVAAPMLEPSHVMSLPKGQAFCLLEGGQLWKVRFPMPKEDPDEEIPKNIAALTQVMKKNYFTADNWWV